jgi:hypothetical protein
LGAVLLWPSCVQRGDMETAERFYEMAREDGMHDGQVFAALIRAYARCNHVR